jgi:RNA polymerase sigma-70 factor (ECF subfamily)
MTNPRQTELVQRLFIQHAAALRGFVASLCPDFAAVDDVVQETFLTVSKKADVFVPGSNFYGWACTIAKYKIMETSRKAQRQGPLLSPEVLDSLSACAPDESDELMQQRLQLLSGCLAKLPPQVRRAVELRYQQAHKPAEVARLLGWGAETAYVTLSRARQVLRDCVNRRMSGQPV